MANTYVLIASNTLGSSAASVTFSSIPGTYTDLVIRCSPRVDNSANDAFIRIKVNSSTTSDYSGTRLGGDGSTATSSRNTNEDSFFATINAATSTSNTFSSVEFYIPNYAGSTNKPLSSFEASENNATAARLTTRAQLRSNTAAITSITFEAGSGQNFVSGSSFWLYGIKKD